jgi:TonB family protein
MPRGLTTLLLSALLSTPALAQFSTSPVLTAPPNVNYPPIAKAAHVSADVTVTFAINPDGTTTAIQVVSGPPMLVGAVVEPIKKWQFKTPLPLNAQTYFEAKYAFHIKTEEEEDDEDNLDNPPENSHGEGVVMPSVSVTGDVHSLDGSQIIDVTAASPAKVTDNCPEDKNRQTPDKTDFSDYVELLRYDCEEGCPLYRVRVYRNGRVSWRGFDGVAANGDREALIGTAAAETLLNDFQTDTFWSACSVNTPPDPKPKPAGKTPKEDDDNQVAVPFQESTNDVFLVASIGGVTKTASASRYSLDRAGETLAWRIDRAADTHRWRHVDPISEPYDNMYDDLESPKPGMTLLIRATYHFSPYNGRQTFTYIGKLLKRGEPVDEADASGWTALMYAAYLDYYSDDEPLKLLLDAHADPNRASLHGDTALMFAAYRGTLSHPLLDHGANLNAHNAEGVTPLMLLAQMPDPGEIKDALAAGANPTAHDNLGRTALDYLRAASCGRAIVPLPKFRGEMVISQTGPQPCPSNTPEFLQSQSLLQAAMKAATTHPRPSTENPLP